MDKKKTVKAEEEISYTCNCPECNETIYSDTQDDWDIHEMVHYDQEIKCDECGCEFMVSL